ncbi:MAG TPA: sugar phosphate isomerase/epimerase family protein, partial [Tepidisphaeraceae bacterium]
QINGHELAVCSWSLQPKGMSDLVEKVKQAGLDTVQLGLLELIQLDDKRKFLELGPLRSAKIGFTAGMISFPGEDYATIDHIRRTGGFVPDDQWPLRRRLAREAARLAQELGMRAVSTHVGFVPHANDPAYASIRDRVRDVAGDFAGFGVDLLMETGQERADELLEFLNDLAAPNVGINFDPANMILYGAGDPIAAIRTLGRHIRHVHAKDAIGSAKPGQEWGQEVAFGKGQVNPSEFLRALKGIGYAGPIALEREAGNDRIGDVRFGIESLKSVKI